MVLELFGLLLLSFVVPFLIFGGGQVLLPIYQSVWDLLKHELVLLNGENFNLMLTITNSTPGFISAKMALISGWLVSENFFFNFFFSILAYTLFMIPSIVIMMFSWKYLRKIPHYKKILRNLVPIVAGILLALIIQLIIKTYFPWFIFNGSNSYFKLNTLNDGSINSEKLSFFKGYKFYLFIFWIVLSIPFSYYLLEKKRVSGIKNIVFNVFFCFLIFQPWSI